MSEEQGNGGLANATKAKISRRSALKALGGITAGAALSGLGLAAPIKILAQENSAGDQHPWPYENLDVEELRKLGHEGYYLGNCSSGAFYAILSALRDKVGEPYTNIPLTPPNNMLHFGGGGIGAGMCCGALLGAFAAINQVTDSTRAREIVAELMEWYKNEPLPTNISNRYGSNREFLVDEYLSDEVITQTVANSAMCEDSVVAWISETGIGYGDDRRKERCARLTGDVVAKAVELLNA